MNSLSATGIFPNPGIRFPKRRRFCSRMPPVFSTLKASPPPLNEFAGDDILVAFFKERELTGDFVAKLSDELWRKGLITNSEKNGEFGEIDDMKNFSASQLLEELSSTSEAEAQILEFLGSIPNLTDEEDEGGFLKLKRTSEWLMGENNSAPMNKKMEAKEIRDDGERRKRLNFLRYEALKRELLLLTVAIGTACSGYCLVAFSVQAAVSYAVGVSFRIGIRSEDLQDSFEKTVKGSSIALSSPRLVFPAAIYGLWELSQHFPIHIFDFQLVPAMMGLFAYKAAALVQVYRDNEDLQLIFPDSAN